jgi:predicted enzyme related to lactoylglutathione lyase
MPQKHQKCISNGISHFDIAGDDLESLSSFYATVFGWQAQAQGPGYALLKTPEGSVQGALVDAESASFTVGVVVPNLDAALKAAAESGGQVVMPKTDNGWVTKGQVADPAGNRITLIQA